MRKKYLNKILSLVLAGSMVLTSCPVSAAPAGADLREQLRSSVSDEQYPNGLIGIGETQLSVKEGEKTTIKVVRQGNTDSEATVRFKAIDVSAAYGKDYLLTAVHSGLKKEKLDVNEEAVPLMEQSAMAGNVNEETMIVSTEVATEDETEEAADSVEEQVTAGKQSGLQAAYRMQVKEEAPFNDWTETNPETAPEDVKEAMDLGSEQSLAYFEHAEGEETVLTFKKDEYMKEIIVDTIDDDKSESEEQFVFAIYDVQGAELSANYNGYVNIQDDEEAVDNVFAIKDQEISVSADEDIAKVTIVRTSGEDQMAFVTVGTKSITAVPNTDYEAVTEELIFAPGVTEKTVEIPIIGDRTETKQFYVGLSDEGVVCEEGSKAAVVTIAAAAAETSAEASGITAAGTKSVTVTNTGNTTGSWVAGPIDLRLAKKITVNYSVWGQRVGSHTEGKCKKKHTVYDYYRDKEVRMVVAKNTYSGDRDILTGARRTHGSESANGSIDYSRDIDKNLEAWSSLGSAYVWVQTSPYNGNNSSTMRVTGITVEYQDYKIVINNDTDYNYYQEKQYTGSKTTTTVGEEINLGKAYFDGKTQNIQKTVVQGGLGLSYEYSKKSNSVGVPVNSNTVDFKGYRFQKPNTTNSRAWSEPDLLKDGLTYDVVKKYKKDYMQSDHTFVITPSFEVKTATVSFNNNNAKVGNKANVKGNFKGFGETTYPKKLDSVIFAASSNAGYAVSYMDIKAGNYTISNKGNGDADKSTFKTGLGDTSATNYTVYLNYETAKLKVMADPKTKNNSDSKQGFVLYMDENKNLYKASLNPSLTGDSNTKDSFNIESVSMNQTYSLIGTAQEGYAPVWRDGTLDDKEQGEGFPQANSYYKSFTPVQGGVLPYTTKLSIGRVYYTFQKAQQVGNPSDIYGYVKIRDRAIFGGEEFEKGINGANITVNGNQVQTTTGGLNKKSQADGFFRVSDKSFSVLNYYLVNVNAYGEEGAVNTSFVMNPGMVGECIIDTKDDLTIRNAKVYLKKDGKFEEQKITLDKDGLYSELSNGKKEIRVEMQADHPGVSMASAELQFYNTEGRKLDMTVAGKPSGDKNSGYFQFDFVPDTLQIPAGATLRVVFTDNQGHKYLQREVGMSLCESIGALDIVNSFAFGGANTVVKLIGKVDSALNLGWNGDFDDVAGKYVSNDPETGDKIISVGFSVGVLNKSFERNKATKANKELTEKTQAVADANKAYSDYVKEMSQPGAKIDNKRKTELQDTIKKAYNDEKVAKANYDKAVKDMEDPKQSKMNMTGEVNLNIGFSFMMVFGKEQGRFYFKSMTLTASVSGGAYVEVEYQTQIGIAIILGFGAGGEGSASFIVEERQDMKHPTKYYITKLKDEGGGNINIFDCNMKNAERKFDAYGAFNLKPYIKLSVGAGILGSKYVTVTVSGTAEFDMTFYTKKGMNQGSVNLSAELTVKVLMIKHTWNLASVNVPLFGNNAGASVGANATHLYDPADVMTAQDISYMKGGSNWKSGKISAKSLDESEDGYAESSIADKIAENPGFRMIQIGEGRYAAVFTNVDPKRENALNAKAVYYTTYEDGKWSTPVLVEDDGTLDQEPNIFDLGDHGAIVTWASADKVFTDETSKIDMQNSMNLHCAFVEKSTGKLSEIQEITKSTLDAGDYNDYSADAAANVSYNEDSMVVYYQKKEYTPQKDGTEYLGDLLFPSVTLMAARTYSFKDRKWTDSFDKADYAEYTDEEFAQYNKGFYGQIFFDFLPQILLDEKLDEEGFWAEQPTVTALKEEDANKALIVDTDAMSYNDLGVFAYTIDHDGDLNTAADRDVYMQIYDFKDGSFLHPIVVNSDSVEDKNVRFVRVRETTYLSWLHNGDIQVLDMGNIVKNYKTLLVKGDGDYYYVDKTKPTSMDVEAMYVPAITVVKGEVAEADNAVSAIGDFDVQSSDDFAYFIWTQSGTSLKDGVEEGTYDAMNPANSMTESQLYTARYDVENGMITKPVQITSGLGANYSSVAFAVEGDNMLGLAYKAESRVVTLEEYNAMLEENNKNAERAAGSNGEGIADNETVELATEETYVPYTVEDYENAVPYAFRVDPKSVVKIKNLAFADRLIAGHDAVATFDILNDGIETVSGLTVTAVDAEGNSVLTDCVEVEAEKSEDAEDDGVSFESKVVESISLDGMIGGDSRDASCQIAIPEDADKTEITISVKDKDGKVIATEMLSDTLESNVVVSDLAIEQTEERDKFKVSGTLSNIGGQKAKAGKAQIGFTKDGENKIAEFDYDELKPDDEVTFEQIVTVEDDAFIAETDEDGAVTETADIYVKAEECTADKTVTRTADEEQMKAVKAVKDVALEGADKEVLQIETGASRLLSPAFTSDLADEKNGITGAESLQYHFVSEDESIVSVENGDFATGMKQGEATVKMYAYPKDSEFMAENQAGEEVTGVLGSYNSKYLTIPQSAVIEKEFTVKVVDKAAEQATTEKPAAQATTEKPTTQPTTQKPAAQATTEKPTTAATTEAPAKVGDTITVENAEYLVSADGEVTFTKASDAAQTSVTIPETVKAADGIEYKVTSVAANAFKNSKKLKKVVLGKNVTTVGKNAFSGCSALTSVTLDAALTKIDASAFANCKKLTKVTIPKNVTTIEKNAFSGCTSLKTVTIKSVKLKKIGKKAFNKINKKAVFKLSGSKKQKAAVKKLFKSSTGYKSTMKLK